MAAHRAGGARDRVAFAAGHGWPLGKPPAARSAPSRSEGAAPRVCSLWLLSLAQARESDPTARKAGGKTHGRESVVAQSQRIKTKAVGRSPPYVETRTSLLVHAPRVSRVSRAPASI